MPETFSHNPWTVKSLVSGVGSGQIRLPDIQRPFVWKNSKVRDLIDSMYNGYPVGQLMFWVNGEDEHSRSIGEDQKSQEVTYQVIDGQQRLTSLYAVIEGISVLRDNYVEERIVIAFNPLTERFAVPDNAVRRSVEWIQDIRDVFANPMNVRRAYIDALEKSREVERLERDLEDDIETSINKLHGVLTFGFEVVQINKSVERETVAEIFVRINSEGVKLSPQDFILTWMSVFWEEGRQQIEDFAGSSHFSPKELTRLKGKAVSWTAQNPYLALKPGHVLRIAVAVGNRRAPLLDAYKALSGRNPRTRQIVEADRERELTRLKVGQGKVLNPSYWDEYLKVPERAGIRTSSMLTSPTTFLYGYAIWLIGRTEFKVPVDELREAMARWFFMAQITGLFSGSSETRAQEILNRIDGLERSPEDFKREIETQIETQLTEDWWRVTFPEDLHTSKSDGPAFNGYVAALNILDADVLLSTLKSKDWIDPTRRPVKGVERHHLFPKDYLKQELGISKTTHINQVANQALVEWSDNIEISNQPPSVYWPNQVSSKSIENDRLKKQVWWHSLPDGWQDMGYQEFLVARRKLIAEVTREGFNKLSDPNYRPKPPSAHEYDSVGRSKSFEDLVRDETIQIGTKLVPFDGSTESIAIVSEDATILLNDEEYPTLTAAARADGAENVDGWEYWALERNQSVVLAQLRAQVD